MSDWSGLLIALGICLCLYCIGDGFNEAAERVVDYLKWKARQ